MGFIDRLKESFAKHYKVMLIPGQGIIYIFDPDLVNDLGGVEALGKHVTIVTVQDGARKPKEYGFFLSDETESNAMDPCIIKKFQGDLAFEPDGPTVAQMAYDLEYDYENDSIATVVKKKVPVTGMVYYKIVSNKKAHRYG